MAFHSKKLVIHTNAKEFVWFYMANLRGRSQAWRRVESLFRQEDQVTLWALPRGQFAWKCQRENMPYLIFPNSCPEKKNTFCRISLISDTFRYVLNHMLDCSLLLLKGGTAGQSAWGTKSSRTLEFGTTVPRIHRFLGLKRPLGGKCSHLTHVFCSNQLKPPLGV